MTRERNQLFDDAFLSRLQHLHLIAKKLSGRAGVALASGRRLGDGLEFADHRAYAQGDDVRFVDWPYYARMERLLLRVFHQHSESPVLILLDQSGSMAGEKFDYARRVAAALAYVTVASLRPVRLQPVAETLGQPMQTGRNVGQILQVLDYLADLQTCGRTHLEECARQLAPRMEGGETILLISDLLDCGEKLEDSLVRLQQNDCSIGVIHVYDREDASPSVEGAVELSGAETQERMNLQVTDALLAAYRERWEAFHRGCEHACLSRAAIYVGAPTETPFDRLVLMTLRKAGVITG